MLVSLGSLMPGMGLIDAHGHHLVNRHKMACNAAFPCPRAIRPRVDFWIDVYSRWSSKDAVLHDANKPDRVYDVIRGQACRGRKGSKLVTRHKVAIAAELRSLASKVSQGKKVWGTEAQHFLSMFPRRDPAEIRRAASNIRCQGGNRDRFRKALKRYGTYRPMVQRVLRQSGLQSDIQYLPFVESLYNPAAYSHLGAAGLWQIMPSTARGLGLRLNATVDERLDPEAATWAAARYLNDSRARLGKVAKKKRAGIRAGELSPFVITSYNYGVNGMERAVKKLGPNFMLVLERYRSRKFRVAVKNFYASFLAARYVAQNAKRYFGNVPANAPLRYRTLKLKKSQSVQRLSAVFGVSSKRLKKLNPALTRHVWKGWRPVPKHYRLRLPLRQGGWASQVKRLNAMAPERGSKEVIKYRVKRGDTICAIASAFDIRCTELLAINRIGKKGFIKVGQKILVPGRGRSTRRATVPANPGSYVVRSGDTGCGVAKRFAVACNDLLSTNGLAMNSVLQVGQALIIPGVLTNQGAKTSYTVRHGDSVCAVAARFGISCEALLAANEMNMSTLIFPGQALHIPKRIPGSVARSASIQKFDPNEKKPKAVGSAPVVRKVEIPTAGTTVEYVVRKGDSACEIALRLETDCKQLLVSNDLDKRAVIQPGQVLSVPGVPSDLAESLILESDKEVAGMPTGVSSGQRQPLPDAGPLDQEIDLTIQTASRNGVVIYRINVEPEETLGHYSDWLKSGGTASIRRLNDFSKKHQLRLGEVLLLPVDSDGQRSTFDRQRRDYHRVLVDEFKQHYDVIEVLNYVTKKGDSLWKLARTQGIPTWLIMRYNPLLRSAAPVVSQVLKMPRIQRRGS